MFVPLPVLILGAVAVLGLVAWALLRGRADRRDDLIAPPRLAEPPIRHGQDGMASELAPVAVAGANGAPVALDDELREDVRKLIRTGDAINAIKLVRERTGLGLKESKNLVDGLHQDDMSLR